MLLQGGRVKFRSAVTAVQWIKMKEAQGASKPPSSPESEDRGAPSRSADLWCDKGKEKVGVWCLIGV